MNSTQLHALKKGDFIWMGMHKCRKHGHSYLEHYSCYEKEVKESPERIGFLDIETSNLDADFGIILSWAIKEKGGKIASSVITKEELLKSEDKEIVKRLIKEMQNYDRLITWYGCRFDMPFIRSRAVALGLDYPGFGAIKHQDIYFISRNKLKLSSNRLENVARVVLGKTNKTRVDGKYWRAALRGDKKSIGYILKHNLLDVIDLERVYDKIIPFVKINNTSF